MRPIEWYARPLSSSLVRLTCMALASCYAPDMATIGGPIFESHLVVSWLRSKDASSVLFVGCASSASPDME
jgi:hypothetical protein